MLPDHLILASASPRRLDLLRRVDLDPEVRVPDVQETRLPGEDVAAMVERLACAKRDSVAGAGEWVVAADTVVVLDGEALGKPGTPDCATAMLKRLSGRTHEVLSGVAVAGPTGRASTTVRTEVTWRELSDEEVADYVATGEPLDKAGGYGLQGGGEDFVVELEGGRDNVIGLPVTTVLELLATVGPADGAWRRLPGG